MKETLIDIMPWVQIFLSFILIGIVLIQQNESGMMGSAGSGHTRTKRGFERVIFIATIVIAILFALSSLFALFAHGV